MKSIKRTAQNLGLLILGVVVALSLLEVGVRVFDTQPPLMYWPDPVLGWVHPANRGFTYPGNSGSVNVHFNSKGLRDVEHFYKKRDGIYRVLVLGDSYTEGVDVELADTFPKKLEKLLNIGGQPSEVINAGVGGYGTDQEFLFLTREGWKYEPDLVVVMFTISNDVHDNAVKGYCREMSGGLACGQHMSGMKRRVITYLKAFAQRHFQLYFFVREKTARLYSVRFIMNKLGLSEFNDADEFRRGLPVEPRTLLREYSAEITRGWRLTLAILSRMNKDAKLHYARFLIVLIPGGNQLERRDLHAVLKALGLNASDIVAENSNMIIQAFGAANDIPVVDLSPAFRAAALQGERLSDGHWKRAGHSLAAAVICRELVRINMIQGLKGC